MQAYDTAIVKEQSNADYCNAQIEEDIKSKVSIPSDLSDDVWGELPKYQYAMHLEQIKKDKEAVTKKRHMVRATLD